METVSFVHMEDGTAEDYELVSRLFADHVTDTLADNLLGLLGIMKGPRLGYPVDRYHDVGDVMAPANHSAVAADILRPYVDDRTTWIIRHHGVFQGYYYFHHLGGDRDERERFRDHEWFDDCAAFCHEYDQNCFEPGYDDIPLEEFAPMVREVFDRPSRFEMAALA